MGFLSKIIEGKMPNLSKLFDILICISKIIWMIEGYMYKEKAYPIILMNKWIKWTFNNINNIKLYL